MGKNAPGRNNNISELADYGYCEKCESYHHKTSDMYAKHNRFIRKKNTSLDEF